MPRVLSIFLMPSPKTSGSALTEQLLNWTARFSPLIALDAPPACTDLNGRAYLYHGINLEISGSEKLFKGEENLVQLIHSGLSGQGFNSRLAAAPTLGCAWAVSRYGPAERTIVQKAAIKEVLAPLPLAALRIPAQLEEALLEVNLTQIGQLLQISRKSLLHRFDSRLLKHLDWALGLQEEVSTPLHFSSPIKAKRILNGGTTQFDSVLALAKELLAQVIKELEAGAKKASQIALEIKTLDAPPVSKNILLSVPTNDKKHLWSLIKTQLEQLNMGFGVESLALSVAHFETPAAEQTSCLPLAQVNESSVDQDFGALIDNLSAQLGETNVLQLECSASHIPEQTFKYLPVKSALHSPPPAARQVLVETERPSLLFYIPQRIQAMALLPDSAPFWLKWKNTAYRITNAAGPERIAPQWWGRDEALCQTRDYFKVQLPGGTWLWIFRNLETSEWFIHGLWV